MKPWEKYQAQPQSDGPWAKYRPAPQEEAEAPQQAESKEGFGARLDREIKGVPRQLGLAARYAIEGPIEAAGVLTEPIRYGLSKIPGMPAMGGAKELGEGIANSLGLPSPEAPNERVVAEASKLLTGSAPIIKGAQVASKGVEGVTKAALERMSEAPLTQAVSASTAGAAGGYVKETGGGDAAQFAASLAGGLGGAAATGLAQKLTSSVSGLVNNIKTARIPDAEINIRVETMLKDSGLSLKQIPTAVRSQLVKEVRRALSTGKQVDPVVVQRIADYGAVGATPTRGTVTLDPVAITQERNLAKMGANSSDPRIQELARIQNQNNAAIITKLNEAGAGGRFADNNIAAGKAITGAVTARDQAIRSTERKLYEAAQKTAGRQIPLDREQFVNDAYRRLAEQNKGAFLPDNLKSLLQQIRGGKIAVDGQEFDVPFNVDVIDNLKTTLATASRGATDGNTRAAISLVREALENTPVAARGAQVGGAQAAPAGMMQQMQGQADDLSNEALKAFDKARRFSRGRFAWQDSAEGIKAALNDIPPDRFVQDYIVAGSNKASFRDVAQLAKTVKRDPVALQATREAILGFIKAKALSGQADETANVSGAAITKALKGVGDDRLALFFSPKEVSELKAVARVAAYETFQPRGSAVNNSNTSGAFAGLLERIAGNQLIGRVPLGKTIAQEPAATWAAQLRAKQALSPMNAIAMQKEQPRNLLIPYATLPLIVGQ